MQLCVYCRSGSKIGKKQARKRGGGGKRQKQEPVCITPHHQDKTVEMWRPQPIAGTLQTRGLRTPRSTRSPLGIQWLYQLSHVSFQGLFRSGVGKTTYVLRKLLRLPALKEVLTYLQYYLYLPAVACSCAL
jgi:hypothetical protein